MFFNAHAFVASKLFNSKNNLLLVGSIIPDIAIINIISWDDGLHGRGNSLRFTNFLRKDYPKLKELGEGVIAHNALDYLSHENYKGSLGYAFQNNKNLANKVKNYYKIDEETSIKIAHNFIESAVDILLIKDNPGVFLELKRAISNVNINFLSKPFAEYFDSSEKEFRKALKIYFKLITKHKLNKLDEWVYLWDELGNAFKFRNPKTSQIKELLNISLRIVSPSYKEFLHFASTAS